MTPSRREFSKFVVAGSVAAGAPIDATLLAAPDWKSPSAPLVPSEQKTAMRRYRFAPYPVVNVIFEKPVYNRGYDNWCPGSVFTDFIVADWTLQKNPGYQQKHNILSFYTPLGELQRSTLVDENGCKSLAARVLSDFQKLLPEFNLDPVEVRISTAVAIRCSWPCQASTPRIAWWPRVHWSASFSATPIPAARNH